MLVRIGKVIIWAVLLTAVFAYAGEEEGLGGTNLQLEIGSLIVSINDLDEGACIQIPISITNPPGGSTVPLLALFFTVELAGDTGIVDGGLFAEMMVNRAFAAADLAGIRNPGVDLTNADGTPTPTCGVILNQAIQGGPVLDFGSGAANLWVINNELSGNPYKNGAVFALFGPMVTIEPGETHVVGILEISVSPVFNQKDLEVRGVPNSVEAGANGYQYETVLAGKRGILSADLDLSPSFGTISICDLDLTAQPADVTDACPGDEVTFSVSVTAPAVSYQWRKNGFDLPGEEADTLNLLDVGPDDLGSYDCLIISPCGNLASTAAQLAFNVFRTTISPPAAAQGLSTITLTAGPDCGIPGYSYDWRDEDDTFLGDAPTLVLDPAPGISMRYFLTVTDGGANQATNQAPVLVNPLGTDLNGDGFNTILDLYFMLEDWTSLTSLFDADGDGEITVRDMLYIDLGL